MLTLVLEEWLRKENPTQGNLKRHFVNLDEKLRIFTIVD